MTKRLLRVGSAGRERIAIALLAALALACGAASRPPQEPARPASFDARLMAYNVLFQYHQVPNDDGSYPAWVCRDYPYVVDHPELRWEHRFPAIQSTIERARPDVLGLSEMRGGVPVDPDERGPEPRHDPAHGPPLIYDMTRWMRDGSATPYRWISVFDLDPTSIEEDTTKARAWPGPLCRPEMSHDGCARYDPRVDHYSSKNFLAYRADRYRVLDSGAVEIPTSTLAERRFAPWARLQEHASGLSLIVVVVHLDPQSGAHRVDGARRIMELVDRHPTVPAVVMGDFNARVETQDECECSCGTRAGCACPEEVVRGCRAQSAYRVLTSGASVRGGLLDTLVHAGGSAEGGSVRAFRSPPGQRWQSSERCWPASLAGENRRHLPPITVADHGPRLDYIFATRDVAILDAAIAAAATPTIDVAGTLRTVHASDHLPVTATVRIERRAVH